VFLIEPDPQRVEGVVVAVNHHLIKTQSRSLAWLP
jgi:hypothetical protein